MPDIKFIPGLQKPRLGAIKLKFTDVVDKKKLPKLPRSFGNDAFVGKKQWGMLGNDQVGDCEFAGMGHAGMLFANCGGKTATFTTEGILSDYSACTGYDPKDPNTDQGTDFQQGLSYFRKTGIIDAAGNRHKIFAYLDVEPGHVEQLYQALWVADAIALGIDFPDYAEAQFNAGKGWSYQKGGNSLGGHFITGVAKRRNTQIVTWGCEISMNRAFVEHQNNQSAGMISEETLVNGKNDRGLDIQGILDYIKALKQPAA